MKKAVVEDHEASYPDPIAVEAGQVIRPTRAKDNWDGYEWLWAEGPDGKSGWIPDTIVECRYGKTYAMRRYFAVELTCRKGEVLLTIEEIDGWAWCRSDGGRQGWVPLRKLTSLEGGEGAQPFSA